MSRSNYKILKVVMFDKTNTRILNIENKVIIIRKIDRKSSRCRLFIDGIERANLKFTDKKLIDESGSALCPVILQKINDFTTQEN